jgi:hypothetical protein
MRRVTTFVLLLGLLGGVGVMLSSRSGSDDAAGEATSDETDTQDDAVSDDSAREEPESRDTADDPAAPPEEEQRPLRVVGLGWEILAAGVLANDGLHPGERSTFKAAGLDAHFAAVADVDALQRQLARGGEDERGADVALLPLPDFVASYERLRGLDPQVFFIVGWSYGRDAVSSTRAQGLSKLPKGTVTLMGAPGRAATLLGLFTLELAGVAPARVELLEPSASGRPMFTAVERSLRAGAREQDARDLLLTTADARELVPIIAIAPAGYLNAHTSTLVEWSRLWLSATEQLRADVPGASRRVAEEEGAPEPVDLLHGLGWIRDATLRDNAHLAGLAGRGSVTIDELFHRTWTLWRGVGVLSTPAPERVPMNNEIISRVALGGGVSDTAPKPKRRGELRQLFVHTIDGKQLDEHELVSDLGFIAGVFGRAELSLRVRKKAGDADELLATATKRFDLDEGRLRKGKRLRRGPVATIAVHVPR